MDLAKYQISDKSMDKIRGGWMQFIGAALIWGLWEIYDSPQDFIDGFKEGAK